ncbi:MAG: NPCBM/NEW2 domain-containing protein [Verrucomicrobiaceae bacterium]|nr:NPCBM/NEW2 domain-containing protein [Verrucomicrobiaceae bacterium]
MKSLLALAFLTTATFAQLRDIFDYTGQNNAPAGTKRLVFIAAKGTHGGGGQHEFLAGAAYLARRINETFPQAFAVVYPDSNWPKDLTKADAIIVLLNHGGRAAEDANIKAACDRGAGFAAIHYGVEAKIGSQGKNYLDWMGGFFETFYSVNPTWEASVQPGQHPVANGVKAFSAKDEWYYHMRFVPDMKGVTPVLSAIAPLNTVKFKEGDKPSPHGGNPHAFADVKAGKPQHLAWAFDRPKGGRGFGFTGFHFFANMTNDSFRTTMLNGVAWVSGLEIPAGGIASKTPTQAELDALMAEAHGPKVAKPAGTAKPVFETPSLTSTSTPRLVAIDVPLKDAKELYLVVSDEGSKSCDWSNWIEPRLIMADGSVKDLTTLKWKGDDAGFGRTRLGSNHTGKPMLVDKQTYTNGIGTHAPSAIAYDLPAGVARFTAKVAIDDGGMMRGGKAERCEGEVPSLHRAACHAGGEGRGESAELQRRPAAGARGAFHGAGGPRSDAVGHLADAFQSDEHRLRRAGSLVCRGRRELSRQRRPPQRRRPHCRARRHRSRWQGGQEQRFRAGARARVATRCRGDRWQGRRVAAAGPARVFGCRWRFEAGEARGAAHGFQWSPARSQSAQRHRRTGRAVVFQSR